MYIGMWHFGLPWRLSGKESAWRPSSRPRFNPWVGEFPWKRKWQAIPVFCLGNPMDRGV